MAALPCNRELICGVVASEIRIHQIHDEIPVQQRLSDWEVITVG